MELLRRLVQIAHPDGHGVKHRVALRVVGQVHAKLHGLFERLEQPGHRLKPPFNVVAAHRQIDFLGQKLVAGNDTLRNRSLQLLLIPLVQRGRLLPVLFHVGRVRRDRAGLILRHLLAALLQFLDLRVILADRLGRLFDAVLVPGGIKGLLQVERVRPFGLQLLERPFRLSQLLAAQAAPFLLFRLQLQNLTVSGGPQLQLGILVQLFLHMADDFPGCAVKLDHRIGQLFIVKDNLPVADEAVGVQHTRKGLGKHGLARTRFAHDGDRLVFVNVQGNAADCRQDSSADAEFDLKVFNR